MTPHISGPTDTIPTGRDAEPAMNTRGPPLVPVTLVVTALDGPAAIDILAAAAAVVLPAAGGMRAADGARRS